MPTPPQRWTAATVYPNMWIDPADDPRNTDGRSPDGELATLLDFIRDYRLTLVMKCHGLSLEQLALKSVPPSTMSLLGLIRHMTDVERDWRNWITDNEPEPALYGSLDKAFDLSEVTTDDDSTLTATFDLLRREQDATDTEISRHDDLGTRLGRAAIAVRELHVHRIEEYARHCGHADLLRECIDGRTGQ
ncbi:DinB family protein [Brevibacterium spongiae]|uniref:DinB family protein n=1 Tax=Brevibacterium spongiae TaxID=2909672 RepID=A0ABY5STN9_9MICO|nr:DinB family protein [Brevibacterium spongiae]UVI37505.1 DinB family protein [Brevibacterium spongiae]